MFKYFDNLDPDLWTQSLPQERCVWVMFQENLKLKRSRKF